MAGKIDNIITYPCKLKGIHIVLHCKRTIRSCLKVEGDRRFWFALFFCTSESKNEDENREVLYHIRWCNTFILFMSRIVLLLTYFFDFFCFSLIIPLLPLLVFEYA